MQKKAENSCKNPRSPVIRSKLIVRAGKMIKKLLTRFIILLVRNIDSAGSNSDLGHFWNYATGAEAVMQVIGELMAAKGIVAAMS